MSYLDRVEIWGNSHHPKWVDYIRIFLGMFLCYKAIMFLVDISAMVSLMQYLDKGSGAFLTIFLGQFVTIVTLLSGIFLIFGIHTRLICMLQIPILIGAIVILNRTGTARTGELLQTILTLILLVCFLVLGNGPLSYSRIFKEEDKTYRDAHK